MSDCDIYHKQCRRCKDVFQTYEISDEFCSSDCKTLYVNNRNHETRINKLDDMQKQIMDLLHIIDERQKMIFNAFEDKIIYKFIKDEVYGIEPEDDNFEDMISWHAAGKGHLHVMKWALKKGYPIGKYSCVDAANGGHLDCLKYAYENGGNYEYTFHGDVCDEAARNGHLDCLKYAVSVIYKAENKNPWNHCTIEQIKTYNHQISIYRD